MSDVSTLGSDFFYNVLESQKDFVLVLENKRVVYASKSFLNFLHLDSVDEFNMYYRGFDDVLRPCKEGGSAFDDIECIYKEPKKVYELEVYYEEESVRCLLKLNKLQGTNNSFIMSFTQIKPPKPQEKKEVSTNASSNTYSDGLVNLAGLLKAYASKKQHFVAKVVVLENLEKIEEDNGVLTATKILKQFEELLKSLHKGFLLLLDASTYIIIESYENMAFEEEAKRLYERIYNYDFEDNLNLVPIVYIRPFEPEDELDFVLRRIKGILQEGIDYKLDPPESVEESIKDTDLDEATIISNLFKQAKYAKSEVNMTTFYKGLTVTHGVRLMSSDTDEIIMKVERIQAYCLTLVKEAIFDCKLFPNAILAKVKYVNYEQRIVVFKETKNLFSSPKERKHSRVQPRTKILVHLLGDGFSMTGEMLDISSKSVALQVGKISSNIEPNSPIELRFSLPLKNEELVVIKTKGELITYQEAGSTFKVINNITPSEPFDAYIMEYIYTRQVELVKELKDLIRRTR